MIKIDKENSTAIFNEETHTYYDKNDGKTYISCTTLIHKYCEEFDEVFWASYKALEALLEESVWLSIKSILLSKKKIPDGMIEKTGLDFNLFEKKKQEILDEYARKRKESTDRGTEIHSRIENEFYNKTNFNFSKYGFEELCGEFVCKKDHYELDLDRGVYPEYFLSITSDDGLLKVAGMIDLLIKDGNNIWICDHKTNKEIKKTSYYDKNKKSHVMMKYPLNNLMDTSLSHYSLQMSLYAYILQTLRPELNVKGLVIHHIDHDGNETMIPCKYLKQDVIRMLNHYKKQIKIQQQLEKNKPIKIC